jgi:P-type Cu+ transporter
MIPDKARRIIRGIEREIPAAEVTPDTLLLVLKDERFPADGVITEGTTMVDERIVTGMDDVEKFPSSRVYAGTANKGGRVVVRATAVGEQTLLRRIELFTQQQGTIQEKKGFFSKFFPKRAVTETLAALREKGIFAANADVIQALRSVDTIVFDKTGIITTGAKHVMHVVSFKPYTQQQLLNTAAAVEAHSNHLTAKAIVSFARLHGASALQRVDDFKEEPGLGVTGKIGDKTIIAGSAALLQKKKIKVPKEALEHKSEGETVIYVASGKEVLGYIALNNPVKKDAKEALAALKPDYRVILLTGEHEETAAAIAQKVAMHEIIADVRPEKREEHIAALQKKGKRVAYVTALSSTRKADVTITMGTRAAFTGDVTILHGHLDAVRALFEEIRKQ